MTNNLSNKIKDTFFEDIGICSAIPTRDVKDFIKQLKKLLSKGKNKDPWGYNIIIGDYEGMIKQIDELVGDQLK